MYSRNQRISFITDEATKSDFKALAILENDSVSGIINKALCEYFEDRYEVLDNFYELVRANPDTMSNFIDLLIHLDKEDTEKSEEEWAKEKGQRHREKMAKVREERKRKLAKGVIFSENTSTDLQTGETEHVNNVTGEVTITK